MKVYSPSQTKAFLTCPFYWKLSRAVMPRTFSKMNLYACRGSAISVGLDEYNRGRSDDEIIQATTDEVQACWEQDQLDVREWHDFRTEPLTKEDILHQALLVVEAYINNPPTAFEVIEAEYIFREAGNARADVLARLPTGLIVPVDYKTKDKANTLWLHNKIVNDFKADWQLLHYCWAIEQEFNVECLEYGICLLWYSANPKIEYSPYTVSRKKLDNWLLSAIRVWRQMEEIDTGKEQLYEVADHSTKFGPCAFQKLCLDFDRDPDYLAQNFIPSGR